MTVRLSDPNLYHTRTLVEQILVPILNHDERVAFLCDAGTANDIISRVRVFVSRRRKTMYEKGQKIRQFTLHATVHPETHNGKRFDCIVMWQSITESQRMTEELDDLLSPKGH